MQEALKNEEYEQAAGHIYRYLTLDENTLRKTVEDSDDLEGRLGHCNVSVDDIALFKIRYKRMDRLPYRQKILNDRNSKICYCSLKDHPKVRKIAKFRCEML